MEQQLKYLLRKTYQYNTKNYKVTAGDILF